MQVLIFKTNLRNQQETQTITLLFQRFSSIVKWSIDLEDCDKVLRIVAKPDLPTPLLQQECGIQGIFLEQLPD